MVIIRAGGEADHAATGAPGTAGSARDLVVPGGYVVKCRRRRYCQVVKDLVCISLTDCLRRLIDNRKNASKRRRSD